MMNKKIVFGTALAVSAFIASCDYVARPKEDYVGTPTPDDTMIRKVLLEDFTGHECGTCPPANIQAASLKNTYGEKLIAISLHTGFLADPNPPQYPENFKTTAGDGYYSFFGFVSNPVGMVN